MRCRYYTSEYHELSLCIYLLLWVCYNSCTILVLSYLVVAEISMQIFDLLSFFLFSRCVGAGGLCGALWLQFYLLLSDLVTDCLLFAPLFGCWWSCLVGSRVMFLPFFFLFTVTSLDCYHGCISNCNYGYCLVPCLFVYLHSFRILAQF